MSYLAALKGLINDTVIKVARIDASTHTMQTIDYSHHEIHSGRMFKVDHSDTELAAAGEIGVLFTTHDSTRWGHVFCKVSCATAANFEILEVPTLDTGNYPTTFYTIINRNRNKTATTSLMSSVRAAPVANQASLKLAGNTTPISGDGTVVHSEALGGDKFTSAGVDRDNSEYVLKQNTTYYFRLLGDGSGAGGVASMQVAWYEHIDKD